MRPPLEHLGENVRRLLTREVHSPELRNAVIAVLEEHSVVQFLGPSHTNRRIDGLVATDVEVIHELLEEQSTQALRRARVPSEQCSFHDFGQVDQRENRLIEVREVPAQHVGFAFRELFCVVGGHGGR